VWQSQASNPVQREYSALRTKRIDGIVRCGQTRMLECDVAGSTPSAFRSANKLVPGIARSRENRFGHLASSERSGCNGVTACGVAFMARDTRGRCHRISAEAPDSLQLDLLILIQTTRVALLREGAR
jgi:hypothetical protein